MLDVSENLMTTRNHGFKTATCVRKASKQRVSTSHMNARTTTTSKQNFFTTTKKLISRARKECTANLCLWLRGIIPHRLLHKIGQASIYEARLWITKNCDVILNRSKFGYSDGTRGQGGVPTAIRPAGFGAATFTFEIINGRPVIDNIEGLGGEDPGEQTVPRSEAWAATILLSRVHLNSVARIGIDAAYVVDGVQGQLN